jgi:pimeloyl-ACP methyl ester carboxylesterase
MRHFVVLLCMVVISGASFAEELFVESSLEVAENHKVYYRHHPAQAGEPTIVLMNGLIYDIENWDEFFGELVSRGFGVLQLAYSTQPESLRLLEPGTTPYYAETRFTFQGPRQSGLEIQTFLDETMAVIDALGIQRFNLLALSYGSIPGGALASQYADRIDNLILSAPAVMASHRYNPYGASRHALYNALPRIEYWEYLYDAELYNTMLPLIMGQGRPADVEFMDFFHGVYQMARSSKWFDLKDMAEVELPPTHLFLASREDPPLYQDQIRFWELMDNNTAKGSMILFEGAPHALPGVVPEEVAEQTEKLIRGEARDRETVVGVNEGHMNASASESDELAAFRLTEKAVGITNQCARILSGEGQAE